MGPHSANCQTSFFKLTLFACKFTPRPKNASCNETTSSWAMHIIGQFEVCGYEGGSTFYGYTSDQLNAQVKKTVYGVWSSSS